MAPAGNVAHDWREAARSHARGLTLPRPARRFWFRVLTVLLPAFVVFAAEVLRHEVLPEYLHDALPEMLGNVLTGATALVISAVILLPIYRRLEAADAQLRTTQVAQAVSGERERLARELHDGVAQALFFLNVKAAALERSLTPAHPGPAARAKDAPATMKLEPAASGEARPIAVEIAKAVQDTSLRVRDAIFDLRTGPEPGQPLSAWIRSYAQGFAELHGLAGDVRDQGTGRELSTEQQLHAMAIVREALHNVAKHAQARAFLVRLTWDPTQLIVVVCDDGRGFPAPLPGPAQGRYGLAALSEHAQAAGGGVRLSPGPDGRGTAVTFRMPYSGAPSGRRVEPS